MKNYFINFFEYNDWCNKEIIDKLNGFENEKALTLMSHILSSQDSWLERLKRTENYSIDSWEVYSLPELAVLSKKSSTGWIRFVSKLPKDGFTKTCTYKNSSGNEFSNANSDIITHVLNHSTYHRSQINFILRLNSSQPANIDYILYMREKKT